MDSSNKHAVVVIPVYKSTPTADEEASFSQCLLVLSQYDIVIVTHKQLNCCVYNHIAEHLGKSISYQYFEERYFIGLQGYNDLCLSIDFYKRFHAYDYMLIYQLDAWVFSDQLSEWCQKGYDYIGAPWFKGFSNHEHNNEIWAVGNGGFSLRRIKSILRILTSSKPVHKRYPLKITSPLRFLHAIMFLLGYHNNMRSLIKNNTRFEDLFFCIELDKTRMHLHRPTVYEAALFSFEQSPRYLFDHITFGKLPFGCHAYRKYEYDTFWSHYIPQ